MEFLLKVDGMMCGHCTARIEKALTALGVLNIKANIENKTVSGNLNGVSLTTVKETITDLGFDVE